MEKLFIPTLHTFAMNNIFTGSLGLFRFRAAPDIVMATPKEVDYEKSSIHVEYWHGLYCYEKEHHGGRKSIPPVRPGQGRDNRLAGGKAG